MIKEPPLRRENRLYQADWLFRFYHFKIDEIVNDQYPDLDLNFDPKLAYAFRNPDIFPIDINRADLEMILRVPGIGPQSARKIVMARRYRRLNYQHLKKIGVVLKRAKYFISCNELQAPTINEIKPEVLQKFMLASERSSRQKKADIFQLSLFDDPQTPKPVIQLIS